MDQKIHIMLSRSFPEFLVYNRISRYREDFLTWMNEYYVPRRVKKGNKVRAIVTEDKSGQTHMATGKEFLRETRFVPEKYAFKIESMIYGDKICFFTCEKSGPAVGIIIENKQIAESQANLFELAWIGAGKFSRR